MPTKIMRLIAAIAAVMAIAVGASAIAGAATEKSNSDSTAATAPKAGKPPAGAPPAGRPPPVEPPAGAPRRGGPPPPGALRGGPGGCRKGGPEEALTGDTADSVRKAALDRVPGGTVIRAEENSDPSSDDPYEAHVRKTDGSEVIVLVNKQFEATDVINVGPPRG